MSVDESDMKKLLLHLMNPNAKDINVDVLATAFEGEFAFSYHNMDAIPKSTPVNIPSHQHNRSQTLSSIPFSYISTFFRYITVSPIPSQIFTFTLIANITLSTPPGATPKAIVERIAKLRREAKTVAIDSSATPPANFTFPAPQTKGGRKPKNAAGKGDSGNADGVDGNGNGKGFGVGKKSKGGKGNGGKRKRDGQAEVNVLEDGEGEKDGAEGLGTPGKKIKREVEGDGEGNGDDDEEGEERVVVA